MKCNKYSLDQEWKRENMKTIVLYRYSVIKWLNFSKDSERIQAQKFCIFCNITDKLTGAHLMEFYFDLSRRLRNVEEQYTYKGYDILMVMISRPLDHVQALPHWQTRLLLKRLSVLPPHLGRVHVSGGLGVGLGQHGHDAQQDLLYALHGGPPLAAGLVAQRVVTRRVQDAVVKNNYCKCTVVTKLSNIQTNKTIKK